MRIAAFRIRNFRRIVDTGWVSLSGDGITALVGQNEAGKTSVLRALHDFERGAITANDRRADGNSPEVYCSFELPALPSKLLGGLVLPATLDAEVKAREMRIKLVRTWDTELQAPDVQLDPEQELSTLFPDQDVERDSLDDGTDPGPISAHQFAVAVLAEAPSFILFDDDESLLPATVDLSEIQNPSSEVEGMTAVRNFIAVSGLDITKLSDPSGKPSEERLLTNASKRITQEFQQFWTQTVGKTSKVYFECVPRNHPESSDRPGHPYLEFQVNDRKERLHLDQRSKGLQWFLSFYLQLTSAKKMSATKQRTMFLIDEPGGSLHAKAQENVLKVLEAEKKDIQVIYTTHSPFLINIEELGRILIAERIDAEDESSPTLVKDVHRFSGDNEDALFPVYTAIGADLSHQRIIGRTDNVLLEEMSAYHYLRAFWLLAKRKLDAHLIPGSGANTTAPMFANLLTGWGLRFVVFLDNDDEGKKALRGIKRHLYAGREDLASNDLLLLPVGSSIEDVLTTDDFRRWVLLEPELIYTETNGDYVKTSGKSKGLLAARFYAEVNKGSITAADLSAESIQNIGTVVSTITDALKRQKGRRN
jgi:hypothetical protein